MTSVQFTAQDTPARPITINSDFVVSLMPLRKVMPTMNSQTPGAAHTVFTGTEIRTSDGLKHNVLEPYDEVDAKLFKTVTYPNNPVPAITQDDVQDVADGLRNPEPFPSRETEAQPWVPGEDQLAETDAALKAVYGKTSDELADEAEAGYDTSKMTPAEKRKRTLEAKKRAEDVPPAGVEVPESQVIDEGRDLA